jgi:hypothetical protein
MKPGLANAFLVGFIESMADFGNPIVVGGQYSVLSTDIFFAIVGAQYDQGRAASLALDPHAVRAGRLLPSSAVLGKQNYTTVSGKGDAGIAMALPDSVRRCAERRGATRGWPSPWWSTCSPLPVASCRPGAATTRPRSSTSDRLRPAVGRVRPGLGRHGLELAVHHRQAGRPSRRRSAPPSGC